MMLTALTLFFLAMLIGGWSIPVGIGLGLHPVVVLAVATSGAMIATWAFLFPGGRAWRTVTRRLFPNAERRVVNSRAAAIVDRWGTPGLASVGLVVLGPTITLLAALVFGVDRRRFLAWSALGTVGFFGFLTVFWSAVL